MLFVDNSIFWLLFCVSHCKYYLCDDVQIVVTSRVLCLLWSRSSPIPYHVGKESPHLFPWVEWYDPKLYLIFASARMITPRSTTALEAEQWLDGLPLSLEKEQEREGGENGDFRREPRIFSPSEVVPSRSSTIEPFSSLV